MWIYEELPYFWETMKPSVKNYTMMLYTTRKENTLSLNSDMHQWQHASDFWDMLKYEKSIRIDENVIYVRWEKTETWKTNHTTLYVREMIGLGLDLIGKSNVNQSNLLIIITQMIVDCWLLIHSMTQFHLTLENSWVIFICV